MIMIMMVVREDCGVGVVVVVLIVVVRMATMIMIKIHQRIGCSMKRVIYLYLSIYLSINQSINQSINLSIYLSIYLSISIYVVAELMHPYSVENAASSIGYLCHTHCEDNWLVWSMEEH